jgi:hypothetical protein
MTRIRACGANVIVDLLEIRVRFLPPNTTALIQPCDQGYIAGLKTTWRTQVNRRLIDVPAADERRALMMINVLDFILHAASRRNVDAAASWNALLAVPSIVQHHHDDVAELEEHAALELCNIVDGSENLQ